MTAAFPTVRPRRLRATAALRGAVAETRLDPSRLVVPHFIIPGHDTMEPIPSLPGIYRMTADVAVKQMGHDLELGLTNHLFFGIPDHKDENGFAAADPDGPVPEALRLTKRTYGDQVLAIADVCLCEYTTHGHCGIPDSHGHILNDPSLARLADAAKAYAAAGADWVAPSDMMDGRVAALRHALDESGHETTGLLSYSVKYASAYYGPFRDAAKSAPSFGDRKSYQMDPRNVREALREAALDEAEGADAIMVKPALAYLDVIRAVRERTNLPVVCYNVSGEYAMVKAAAERGLINEAAVVRENLLGMARAGADLIITYHARDAVEGGWLQ
ncbi:MAG TPA: porphobilinogen synthase [Candidatus Thermoplasmatota archaeon]|nr:porphobilinogen synthase [Candidatus Thermoplasmatota archaeon]